MWWIIGIAIAIVLFNALGNAYLTASEDERFKMLIAMINNSKMYYIYKNMLLGFVITIALVIGLVGSILLFPLIIIELLIGPLLERYKVKNKIGNLFGGKKK